MANVAGAELGRGMEMPQRGGMAVGEVKEASSCGNEGFELSLKG